MRDVLAPTARVLFFPNLIRLSSGCRINLDSSLNQSDMAQLTCHRCHFSRAPLDCVDRGTQSRGAQTCSPIMCSLRRTVVADIILQRMLPS
ncbi:uncharacterized protein NPIL_590671 [Nephila pilipes]|uniref:Uncharacterized protein n=1 Tax=Nephila pilipes TaxID=299642 RepID=A0A8X6UH56_NEPPI|nr:uncharacterized protein NPIL_590671 [Nephila pilipes]